MRLVRREVAGREDPLIWGLRLIVGAGVPPRFHRPPPVGFLRRKEHVLAQIHKAPQLVEQRQLFGGVITVSKSAFADDVAVLLLNMGVVIRGVRAGASHENCSFSTPADQRLIDELATVVQTGHRIGQPVRDLGDRFDHPFMRPVPDRDVLGVQPVNTSVAVSVQACSPLRL